MNRRGRGSEEALQIALRWSLSEHNRVVVDEGQILALLVRKCCHFARETEQQRFSENDVDQSACRDSLTWPALRLQPKEFDDAGLRGANQAADVCLFAT